MTSSKPADQGSKGREPKPFPRKVENLIANFRGLPENRSRSRDRGIREMGQLVDQLLNKFQIGQSSPEETLRGKWTEIVGPANAAYSHPLQIATGGKLHVLVSHAVVRSELQLHTDRILARAQALPGCESIKRLVLRMG